MSEFTYRAATSDDLEAAAAVMAAEERGVLGESTWGPNEMRDWWAWVNLEKSWIVESDGEPAAIGLLMPRDSGRVIMWIAVDPRFAGRGLATELLARGERDARAVGGKIFSVGRLAKNTAAQSLFDRHGLDEVRRYFQMRIDFDGEPDQPSWPEGVAVSTFRREDARAFKATLDEAFAEEWGHVVVPFDEWVAARVEDPMQDHSLWFIARDGDDIAGVLRGEAPRHGGGFVGMLGVRNAWRKRGIGLGLLQHAFCEFHRRGYPHASLGVDSENPTGATRLYERAGMRVVKEDVVHEKKLT
jgi:mycothiol synthase